jgi:tRNA pseudouridine38-40 synthase
MRNIKLVLEYDGTDFSGWQYQPDRRTVQGDIENALSTLLNEKTRIIGAGRTDQGVHARGQVANFATASRLSMDRMCTGLNALTADDIYVRSAQCAEPDFHSRFSALSKIYQYHVITTSSPLKRRYTWYTPYPLDIQEMEHAAQSFIGTQDFHYLSAGNDTASTVCRVHRIDLTCKSSDIIITIEGDRFLRKMVRGIVGFMHDVGRKRYSVEQARAVLAGDVNNVYFAPPHGLCLVEIKYP